MAAFSSIDADEFWTRIFGQKPEEMNVVTTSDRAKAAPKSGFDFKRALAGASRDDGHKTKCHSSRVSSDDAIPEKTQRPNSSSHPSEYALFRRFCERNPACAEVVAGWQCQPQFVLINDSTCSA